MDESIQIWNTALAVQYPRDLGIEISLFQDSDLVIYGLPLGAGIEIAKESDDVISVKESPSYGIDLILANSNDIDVRATGTILYHPTNVYLPEVKTYLSNSNDLVTLYIGNRALSQLFSSINHTHDNIYDPGHSHDDRYPTFGYLNSWFELVNPGTENEYLRVKKSLAGDKEIQAWSNTGWLPPDIWASMPVPSTTTRGGIILGTGTSKFLREDGRWESVTSGTFNHAAMQNLDYPSSGHTGFAPEHDHPYSPLAHNHAGVYELADAKIQTHISSQLNPHNVTKAQVGLGSVPNIDFSQWFLIMNQGQANEYLRCLKPFAGDYEIQAWSNNGQFPAETIAGITKTGEIGKFLQADGSWVPVTAGSSYSFRYSISENGGSVNLAGDLAFPGNSKIYGTNINGVRGWYDAPTGGSSQWETTGNNLYYSIGNVGIGETTPLWANLHINKNTVNGIGGSLFLTNRATSTTGNLVRLGFDLQGFDDSTPTAAIDAKLLALDGKTELIFNVYDGSGLLTYYEKARISSDGMTLQGDSSATTTLNVGGTLNGKIRVRHIDGKSPSAVDVGALYLQYSVNNHTIVNGGNSTGVLSVGDDPLTGSSIPKFYVKGLSVFDNPGGAIRVVKTTRTFSSDDLGIFYGGGNYYIADWNTGTKGLLLNTGTGKTEVRGFLDIYPTSSQSSFNEGIRVHTSVNDWACIAIGAIAGDNGSGTGQWSILRQPSVNYAYSLSFNYAGTEKVRIHTSGFIDTTYAGFGFKSYTSGYSWQIGSDVNTGDAMYLYNNLGGYVVKIGTQGDINISNGWFRNDKKHQGLFNQETTTHLYSNGHGYWTMAGNGSATGALCFKVAHESTIKGYTYWDANGFGLLNNGGAWGVRLINGGEYAGGALYGSWFVTGVGSMIRFDTSGDSGSNYICTINNYDLTLYCGRGNSSRLTLSSNGRADFSHSVYAPNFILSSDRRLKKNIVTINPKPLNTRYVEFEAKAEPGIVRYGVIADELEKYYPELVRQDENGIRSVAYVDLLIREIANLKDRIYQLEMKGSAA